VKAIERAKPERKRPCPCYKILFLICPR